MSKGVLEGGQPIGGVLLQLLALVLSLEGLGGGRPQVGDDLGLQTPLIVEEGEGEGETIVGFQQRQLVGLVEGVQEGLDLASVDLVDLIGAIHAAQVLVDPLELPLGQNYDGLFILLLLLLRAARFRALRGVAVGVFVGIGHNEPVVLGKPLGEVERLGVVELLALASDLAQLVQEAVGVFQQVLEGGAVVVILEIGHHRITVVEMPLDLFVLADQRLFLIGQILGLVFDRLHPHAGVPQQVFELRY